MYCVKLSPSEFNLLEYLNDKLEEEPDTDDTLEFNPYCDLPAFIRVKPEYLHD